MIRKKENQGRSLYQMNSENSLNRMFSKTFFEFKETRNPYFCFLPNYSYLKIPIICIITSSRSIRRHTRNSKCVSFGANEILGVRQHFIIK